MTSQHRTLISQAARRRPLSKGAEGTLNQLYTRAEHTLKAGVVVESELPTGIRVVLSETKDQVQVIDNGEGYFIILTSEGLLQLGQLWGRTLPPNGPVSAAKVW